MDGHGDVLDAAHVLHEAADAPAKVVGQRIAGGVGDVHDRGARGDDGLYDALEELLLGAAGVLGVEFDVVHVPLGVLDRMDGLLDSLLLGQAQLVAQVTGRDAQAGVDAGALGGLEGTGGLVDVLLDRAGQGADHGVVASELADLVDALEVAGARDGKAGLDDVDLEAQQLAGDENLLVGVHRGTGRLLAVAQGGVKNGDLAGHGTVLLVGVFDTVWGSDTLLTAVPPGLPVRKRTGTDEKRTPARYRATRKQGMGYGVLAAKTKRPTVPALVLPLGRGPADRAVRAGDAGDEGRATPSAPR